MKVLVFNGVGAEGKNGISTAGRISNFISKEFEKKGYQVQIFDVASSGIPLLDTELVSIPDAVINMAEAFQAADLHIWLAPMYHGCMPGAMKNCLDWLEITSKNSLPYLTNKLIGLICWADGGQAMMGVNSMDNVAKSLRAWVLPYTIPIVKNDLFVEQSCNFSSIYQHKFEKMVTLMHDAKQFIHLERMPIVN